MGRAAYGIRIAALLLVIAVPAWACGSDDAAPTPLPTATSEPMPPPTAIATPSLAPSPATSLPTDEPPDRDLVDLARRFRGLPANAPLTARETPYGYAVGDREEFAIVDINPPS